MFTESRFKWIRRVVVAAVVLAGAVPMSMPAAAEPVDADLAITKTDGVATATPGGSVTYTITASNAGTSTAFSATVADTFPAAITAATWTCVGAGGGTCTAAGSGNINDTVMLPVGGSVTYTATASISEAALGGLYNNAYVTAPEGVDDPRPGNNIATDSDTIEAVADLTITKTDGVTTATPGGSVTYTITASNAGPLNITDARIDDTFPAALTATWTCVGAGGGTCTASGSGDISDMVDLPAGGSVTYTATAAINSQASGSLSNTATVIAPEGITDPNPADNSATDTDLLVAASALTLTKTATAHVVAGGNITYEVTVGNDSPSTTGVVQLTDALPAGTTFVSATQGSGPAASITTPAVGAAGTVTATFSELAVGANATFTIVAKVNAGTPGGTVITNTASAAPAEISSTQAGPVDVTASAATTVDPTVDLSLTKQLQGGLLAGTNATYLLTVQNIGVDATTGTLTLTDTLPAALDFVSAAGTGWSCAAAGQTVTCTRGTSLAAGASTSVTLTVHVHADATGTIVNHATVNGVDADSAAANNGSSASSPVVPSAPTTTTTTTSPRPLPATGSDSSALVRLAVTLIAIGLAVMGIAATRRRTRTS